MKPEEKARIKIDQMFIDAGWAVVDRDHYAPNITAVAIKEGLLKVIWKLIIFCLSTERQSVY